MPPRGPCCSFRARPGAGSWTPHQRLSWWGVEAELWTPLDPALSVGARCWFIAARSPYLDEVDTLNPTARASLSPRPP